MKPRALFAAAMVSVIAVSTVSSILAYRAGQRHSLGLQKGTLVGTLDALERIRSGDIQAGTRRIESLCFMSAVVLMADEHYRSDFAVRTMTPALIQYRGRYRTNRADWSVTENQLEELFVQVR